jgi:hypothetical protein
MLDAPAGSAGCSTGHEGQAGSRKLLQTVADAVGNALNVPQGLSNAVSGALGLTGLQLPGLNQQGLGAAEPAGAGSAGAGTARAGTAGAGTAGTETAGTGAAGAVGGPAGGGSLQEYLYRVSGLQGHVNAARKQANSALGEAARRAIQVHSVQHLLLALPGWT